MALFDGNVPLFVWYGFGAETSWASELRALLEYGTNWRLCKRFFGFLGEVQEKYNDDPVYLKICVREG